MPNLATLASVMKAMGFPVVLFAVAVFNATPAHGEPVRIFNGRSYNVATLRLFAKSYTFDPSTLSVLK